MRVSHHPPCCTIRHAAICGFYKPRLSTTIQTWSTRYQSLTRRQSESLHYCFRTHQSCASHHTTFHICLTSACKCQYVLRQNFEIIADHQMRFVTSEIIQSSLETVMFSRDNEMTITHRYLAFWQRLSVIKCLSMVAVTTLVPISERSIRSIIHNIILSQYCF